MELNILNGDSSTMTYTGTISLNKINILYRDEIYYIITAYGDTGGAGGIIYVTRYLNYYLQDGTITQSVFNLKYYLHFITMTNSSSNVALYLTIKNADETELTADTLASYLAGKKVLANGNLHGVVPTYIAGEGGVIKVYYRTPGDSNINPTPDEYQDLSSFTITDLVSPVE